MKLDEIQKMWSEDAKISDHELDTASLDIPVLHAKYLQIMTNENQLMYRLSATYDMMIKDKSEYYMGTMCEEDLKERGWEPYGLKVLKPDLQKYINADQHVIDHFLILSEQRDKVETLKSILTVINNRSFHIQNAINWRKFTNGIN